MQKRFFLRNNNWNLCVCVENLNGYFFLENWELSFLVYKYFVVVALYP